MAKKNLYSDIIVKLNQLLAMNTINPTYTFGSKSKNSLENIMKRQKALIAEIEQISRANNTLLGRTVKFPKADSYALYVVTKVNKATVELSWIRFCDAWQDDRLGYFGNIDINYVQNKIDFDDKWNNMAEARDKEAQTEVIK